MDTGVEITCLCGKARQKVFLQTLPPEVSVCHCNICRWTTGGLLHFSIPLREPPTSIQGLSRYDSTDKMSRLFCGTCGTHLCHRINQDGTWHVASGVVDHVLDNKQGFTSGLQKIAKHQFVGDTVDGGLAVCLTGFSQAPAEFHLQGADGTTLDDLHDDLFSRGEDRTRSQPRLRAACHCAGVEFFLSRPNEASRACSSPWPDLLRAYHSFSPENPDDEKWWICGSQKFLAGTCACQSCRLSLSSPITCWAFIPRANLSAADGSLISPNIGTLQTYSSSQGRTRGFCRVCGASVFLRIDERPELWDINLGLFRAIEGARAEDWFQWATDRVSFAEEALNKGLIAIFETGLSRLNRESQRP